MSFQNIKHNRNDAELNKTRFLERLESLTTMVDSLEEVRQNTHEIIGRGAYGDVFGDNFFAYKVTDYSLEECIACLLASDLKLGPKVFGFYVSDDETRMIIKMQRLTGDLKNIVCSPEHDAWVDKSLATKLPLLDTFAKLYKNITDGVAPLCNIDARLHNWMYNGNEIWLPDWTSTQIRDNEPLQCSQFIGAIILEEIFICKLKMSSLTYFANFYDEIQCEVEEIRKMTDSPKVIARYNRLISRVNDHCATQMHKLFPLTTNRVRATDKRLVGSGIRSFIEKLVDGTG